MSDNNFSELLSAYLDGEVEGEELNRVNALLTSSAEARQELELLQQMKVSLSSAPRLSAPPDLVALLLANPKLHKKQSTGWWNAFLPASLPRWSIAPIGAAFAALAVFVGVNSPWAAKPLPFEPLLAAHERQITDGGLQGRIMAASNYSSLLAAQHEQSR